MGAVADEVKARQGRTPGPIKTPCPGRLNRLRAARACAFSWRMRELRRTNDLVYLSFAEAALRSQGLNPQIFDGALSAVEGSIGALPRRLVVPEDEEAKARRILDELDAAHART